MVKKKISIRSNRRSAEPPVLEHHWAYVENQSPAEGDIDDLFEESSVYREDAHADRRKKTTRRDSEPNSRTDGNMKKTGNTAKSTDPSNGAVASRRKDAVPVPRGYLAGLAEEIDDDEIFTASELAPSRTAKRPNARISTQKSVEHKSTTRTNRATTVTDSPTDSKTTAIRKTGTSASSSVQKSDASRGDSLRTDETPRRENLSRRKKTSLSDETSNEETTLRRGGRRGEKNVPREETLSRETLEKPSRREPTARNTKRGSKLAESRTVADQRSAVDSDSTRSDSIAMVNPSNMRRVEIASLVDTTIQLGLSASELQQCSIAEITRRVDAAGLCLPPELGPFGVAAMVFVAQLLEQGKTPSTTDATAKSSAPAATVSTTTAKSSVPPAKSSASDTLDARSSSQVESKDFGSSDFGDVEAVSHDWQEVSDDSEWSEETLPERRDDDAESQDEAFNDDDAELRDDDVRRVSECKTPLPSFGEMRFSDAMMRALAAAGYSQPTPIQAGLIPLALEGEDLMGQAQTGTGKTAAFAIPILEKTESRRADRQPAALVLCPTRELAVQTRDEFVKLAGSRPVRVVALYGGKPIKKQADQLHDGADIIVGTPGRILDHLNRRTLTFASVRIVVLDEADRMLDIGFRPDIEKILRRCPESRQTLLLSATLPPPVKRLAERYMHDPEVVDFSPTDIAAQTIEQFYFPIFQEEKYPLLVSLLQREQPTQAIVFCRTRRGTEKIGHALQKVFDHCEPIHGDLAQTQRDRVMRAFRAGEVRILVATDVVGRGIDVSGISHIVNYDIPQFCDDYVHRVGRAGRMGREGIAFTLVTPEEGIELTRIEMRINQLLAKRDPADYITRKPHQERGGWVRRGGGTSESGKDTGTDPEAVVEPPKPKEVFGRPKRRVKRTL